MDKKAIVIVAILATLLMVGSASAYAELTVDPDEVEILIGGDPAELTLTLNTSETGPRSLTWSTADPAIIAAVESDVLTQTGTYNFNSPGGVQTFALAIQATEDAVVNERYDVSVWYGTLPFSVKAAVTATVVPIPEISTMALTSAGLIGLVGLTRKRKN